MIGYMRYIGYVDSHPIRALLISIAKINRQHLALT